MSYETFMEARANQGCELDWDAEQCTCENNGDYCDYCWRFHYPEEAGNDN